MEICTIQDKRTYSVISALKFIFVRHVIPHNFMAYKGIQHTMQFSRILKFLQPVHLHTKTFQLKLNPVKWLSKLSVKNVKRIIKKYKDRCLGLLECHNIPITGFSYSPSQLLMNQSTGYIRTLHNRTL